MKKYIILIICIAMLFPSAMPVLAESANSNGSSGTSIGVNATYTRPTGGDTIVSVDIAWDNMNFTFTQTDIGTWLPGEHRYDDDASGVWDTTARNITITNHSNTGIASTFSFESGITSMGGTFTKDFLWVKTADDESYRTPNAEGTYPAPSKSTAFSIDPSSPPITESKRLGTITVGISTALSVNTVGMSEDELMDLKKKISDEKVDVLNLTVNDRNCYEVIGFFSNNTFDTLTLSGVTTIDNGASKIDVCVDNLILPDVLTIEGDFIKKWVNPSYLLSVNAPKLGNVSAEAFSECNNLRSVFLPEVTSVENSAFENCTNLQDIYLPNVTSIGENTFNGCTALLSVSLPEAMTIGKSAFDGCTSLQSVSLPEAIIMGESAFNGCLHLRSVSLPKATEIKMYAFRGCRDLISISLPEAINIGYGAFGYCESLQSVSLPKATEIEDFAFQACRNLISISLPEARSIGKRAFNECSSLTTVSIPKVSSLWEGSFNECTSLVSIELPSVTSINYNDPRNPVFSGCTALRSITFGKVFTNSCELSDDVSQITLTLAEGQLDSDRSTPVSAGVGATYYGQTYAEIIITPSAGE